MVKMGPEGLVEVLILYLLRALKCDKLACSGICLLQSTHACISSFDFTLLEAFFKDGFRITIFNVTHTYLHCPLEYWLPLSIRTVYTYGISFFITKKVTMAKSWQNAFSHSFFLLICLTFLVYKLYFICWNKFTEFPIGFYP